MVEKSKRSEDPREGREPTWDEIGEKIGQKIEKAFEEGKFDDLCGKKSGVKHKVKCEGSSTGGCFYFLGFLGALVYYVSTDSSFMGVVIGFLKSLVWPGFLVWGAFKALGL